MVSDYGWSKEAGCSDKVVDNLMNSYMGDKEPFITTNGRFPERDNGFIEVQLLKELLFPHYWNNSQVIQTRDSLIRKVNDLGQSFFNGARAYVPSNENAHTTVNSVLEQLGSIREKLKKDVEAAYTGDPAAKSYTEIIRAYPGFRAVEVQRVAHVFYNLGVTQYARELTEEIHSKTGIDIHPGAKIGEYFFIDHGTGVVIGETAEIGNWVRIYQGVTLGVLHFEKEGGSILKKGYKRHPTIGSHVVIGAGAKILGPVKIGDHVNIGANTWIAEDVPSHTTVFVAEHPKQEKREKTKRQ